MPNWCSNTLTVVSEASDILELERFYYLNSANDHNDDTQFLSLNSLVSKPNSVSDEEVGLWRKQHWGVSRDVHGATVERGISDSRLIYNFDTASNPPVKWLVTIQKLFPSLSFSLSYMEAGYGLIGEAVTRNGEIINESRNMDSEDFHYIGAHDNVPVVECEVCDIDDFSRYHANHGPTNPLILESCVICRHQANLPHAEDACQLCFEQR